MPLIKRGKTFSVTDVLEAILNGDNSDFEIESENSDSDEEDTAQHSDISADEESEDENETEIQTGQQTESLSSDSEDVPCTTQCRKNSEGRELRWLKKEFVNPETTFTGADFAASSNYELQTPLQYFQRFVSQEMLYNVMVKSNEYSLQKHGTVADISLKDLEQMIGMYLHMGIVQMPGVWVYWETDTRYGPIADVMTRNRFQCLLSSIHFVDNLTVTDEQKQDKLWKIRPWLESFREKCLQIVPEEHNSIDEMMIPFKGRFSGIRQYMRGKPHPWGFKIWARTGISGMLCDFDVYQGSVQGKPARSELGISGDTVMRLASTLPTGQNYKVYADNFFTSVPLLVKLLECGIHFVGTVRPGRVPNLRLAEEKELKKQGRGSFDFRVSQEHNICAVRWYDNRSVTLLSTFDGPNPVDKVARWNKSTKSFTEVRRPSIVKTYNKFMGGIDLLDSFTAKYKFHMRSKRWYMYIFWHTIIIAVVNAWLQYKRDCRTLQIPVKEVLNRRRFQAQLSASLIQTHTIKRGRPSMNEERSQLSVKKKVYNAPPPDVRKDCIGHFPHKDQKRGRCR
ncbi:piggyBac transposable element-derived protein 3-like [Boleophthalmus pectinirostris]|uniref:piggyBac transposable element-derived protein 3-like n=1 Tax=Boleophthalmus pectinirostris TaxID=150288 RepID=UPI0024318C52|nr:piggyBac transposable element-derived protein 3-like [Boleophthalmus pectinirostris]